MTRVLVAGALMAAVLLTVARADAADPDDAETWNAEGVKLRKANQVRKALAAFQRALELQDSPRSHGQLGFVQHDIGALENDRDMFVPAEENLVRALAADRDKWVIKNRKYLLEALDLCRQNLGAVRIEGGVEGAVVRVNGASRGTMPVTRPMSLPVGPAVLKVEAAGYLAWEHSVSVAAGKEVLLNVDLVPERRDLPSLVPSAAKEPASDEPRRQPSVVERPNAVSPPDEPGWRTRKVLAVGLGGVSAASLVASAFLWRRDGRPSCDLSPCPTENYDFSRAKWSTLVGGIGGLVGAGWLWISDRQTVQLGLNVNEDSMAFVLRGSL
jgi:hypothetical protein